MDENSNEILEHIENQRDRLGQNLQELEDRVRNTTDWRNHFERHPMVMMSLAMGGGMLLSAMVTPRKNYYGSSSSQSWSSPSSSTSSASRMSSSSSPYASSSSSGSSLSSSGTSMRQMSEQKRRAMDALDQIGAALVAFATSKAKEYLTQSLPGFDRHLQPEPGMPRDQHAQERSSYSYGNQPERNPQQQGTASSSPQSPGQQSASSQYLAEQQRQADQNQGGQQRTNLNPQPSPNFPV